MPLLLQQIKTSKYLKWQAAIKQQEEKDFFALSEEEQKKALFSLLDKNFLYVNLQEIDDADYSIKEEDKRLTKEFYNIL